MKKKTKAPISALKDANRRIGQIVGAFGIKGQVKVEPLTDFLDRFEVGTSLLLEGEVVEIEDAKWHKERLLLKLSGVDTPEDAQSHQFQYLLGSADYEPDLEDDEYMTADLIGLKVQTPSGKFIGVVDDILVAPAHDIIQIGEILVPAVKEFVKKVDLKKRIMTIEFLDGMLPEENE